MDTDMKMVPIALDYDVLSPLIPPKLTYLQLQSSIELLIPSTFFVSLYMCIRLFSGV